MTFMDRFEQAKTVYHTLNAIERCRLRRAAADRLVEEGCEEVGTSDVSCKCMTFIETGEYKDLIKDEETVDA